MNLNKFAKEVNKINWSQAIKRKQALLFHYFIINGATDQNEYKKLAINYAPKNWRIFEFNVCFDEKEKDNLSKYIFDKGIKYIHYLIKKCYQWGNEVLRYSEKIKKLELEKASAEKLINLFIGYKKRIMQFAQFIYIPLAMQKELEKRLKVFLDQKKLGRRELITYQTLINPIKNNFTNEEIKDLYRLALKIKNKSKNKIDLEINNHLKKYAWIGWIYFLGQPWTKKDILIRIKNFLENKNLEKNYQELIKSHDKNQQETGRIIKILKASSNIIQLIEFIKEFVYLRTWRTDIHHLTGYNIRNLLTEIGKRFGYKLKEIIYLSAKEIINLPQKFVAKNEIKNRQKEFALFKINGKFYIFSGKQLITLKKLINKEKIEKFSEIKGSIAQVGKVSGVVRIIKDKTEVYKVRKNDILVTSMTIPDFVPAIEKAAAIITDEGGIMCHAAIIAREMKKPCIVGTKIATKVLRDGDLVEVDAKRGVVKILKKGKK